MKLVWCPESASKAYTDAVKGLADRNLEETDLEEMVSAMAGGWKAKLIVEVWASGDGPATSIGLSSAARHADGRHVCIVPDQHAAAEYTETMRLAGREAVVVVGDAEDVMRQLDGVEMLVVDLRRRDAAKVLREARPGPRGMVVVCKRAVPHGRGTPTAMRPGTRVVRSTFLPIGNGAEIFQVGVGKGPRVVAGGRWIRHVDRSTGEEHVFRR